MLRRRILAGPAAFPACLGPLGFPQIGVDARGGQQGGSLYLAWSDFRNGDVDVFLASSSDRGRTWSGPTRVNSDPIHDGIDQFFQWMAVDPVSGDVYVQFYDRRDDPDNRKTGFTLARSTDRGKTFGNYSWAETPFASEVPAFLGDYTWLTAYDRKVYGAWTEALPLTEVPSKPGSRPRPETAVRVGFADFSDSH
jgi:hypothetical protein